MSTGWIKLHRGLLDWEWYDDINVTRLFLHLILKAHHKEKKYKGALIKRGQLLTGRELLSNETGLSQQQIRTCLTKLKSTNDITIKSTSKGTLLTVDKYGIYQGSDIEATNKLTNRTTNEQPTSNQRVTTNKNVKNEKNVNKKELIAEAFEHWWKTYPKKSGKVVAEKSFINKTKKMSDDEIEDFVNFISKDSANRYKETEKQFIPNPTTYLNQERYNDE